MIYFLYGPDSTLIYQKIKADIKKKVDVTDPLSFARFNSFQDTVQDVVMEASSLSFTGEGKVVVLENCYFLSTSKEKVPPIDKQQDFTSLKEYITNSNPDCDLYLLCVGKPNKKNELVSLLDKRAMVTEVTNPSEEEYVELAMRMAVESNSSIDRDSALAILKRSGNDYTLYINNLKKLFTYTKAVRYEDVDSLVISPLADDVFALFESLVKNEPPTEALKIVRQLFRLGYDTYKLLPVLASQFRFLSEVAYLVSLHKSEREISEDLKCHPYRVTCAKRNLGYLNFKTVVQIMADLSMLEKNMKYEQDDGQMALELFICNFRRNYVLPNKKNPY